jgi:hypothetical protein
VTFIDSWEANVSIRPFSASFSLEFHMRLSGVLFPVAYGFLGPVLSPAA